MQKKFLQKYCALAICLAFCSALPLSARASGDAQIWPDIHDVRQRLQDQENAAASGPLVVHEYTEDELDALFRNLPRYVETGSFSLSRVHRLPVFNSADLPSADRGKKYIIVRPAWESLKQDLTDMLAAYQGDWAVYLKDLATGQTMEINEHSMESASLIKLYIAGATYEQIELGNLPEDDTILSALDAMITVSDNESSNVLVRAMCDDPENFQTGLAKVNDFIDRYGFSSTEQVNGIADPSLWVADGRVNMTSPADCGRFLEMVYNGTLVSHFSSFRLEVLLNRQEVNYKIPDGLPEAVHISHKTGEVDDTENDAAIIYTPYGDYIFCIMSTDLTDTDAAVEHIHHVTDYIYRYFTGYVIPADTVLAEWNGDAVSVLTESSVVADPGPQEWSGIMGTDLIRWSDEQTP